MKQGAFEDKDFSDKTSNLFPEDTQFETRPYIENNK